VLERHGSLGDRGDETGDETEADEELQDRRGAVLRTGETGDHRPVPYVDGGGE
jgi:hypothetical protein